jgi:hypothetical protein
VDDWGAYAALLLYLTLLASKEPLSKDTQAVELHKNFELRVQFVVARLDHSVLDVVVCWKDKVALG